MKKIWFKTILAGSVTLSGCASMFNGSSQQVSIHSNLSDAKLYVNEQYIGKEYAITTFKKKQNYTITARKDNCDAMSIVASKSFDATTLLGLFIDYGIISILVIDGIGTGAWQQFDQTSYLIDPKCSG